MGETTTIQSSVALADKQWLVFESVTKTNPDGTIHSGLIAVRAACIAPAKIPQQGEIFSRRGYEKIPSKFTVNVSGAVRVPGFYVFDSDKDSTLIDALRLAGGLSDDAGKTITVKRKKDHGNAALIQFDLVEVAESLDSNILLAASDVVVVERTEDDAAEAKPIADAAPVFVMCVYPVADLLLQIRQKSPMPRPAPPTAERELSQVYTKEDFAQLVELIKASVEPESWGNRGTIVPDTETRSLVIHQTDKAHNEIAELIKKLRSGQDANVQITSLLVKLTNEEQLKVIEEHNTLHSFADGKKWALLTPKRSETFTKALLDQKPETISSPNIMTISGQAAMIMVGSMDQSVFSGIKLTVTPQLLRDSSIIRLQHAVTIGTDRQPNETSGAKINTDNFALLAGQDLNNAGSVFHESLVGSGQTLLLLIEQPRANDAAKSVDRYVLMLTPEHVVDERFDGGK